MARTVRQLVDQALGLVGVFSIGQTSDNEDTSLALSILQDKIHEFYLDGLMVPFETTDSVSLVTGQANYTIGTSGSPDIDSVRPERIDSAYVRTSNIDYRIDIISKKEYDRVTLKTLEGIPRFLYYNPTMQNGNIYLYPTPNTGTLYVTSTKSFTEPTDLTDDIVSDLSIPRSYFNALKFILAAELNMHFPPEKQILFDKAAASMRQLASFNFGQRVCPVAIEPKGVGAMNWHYKGEI